MDDLNLMNIIPVAFAILLGIAAFLMMFTTFFTSGR